jgi:hypothetical protein
MIPCEHDEGGALVSEKVPDPRGGALVNTMLELQRDHNQKHAGPRGSTAVPHCKNHKHLKKKKHPAC